MGASRSLTPVSCKFGRRKGHGVIFLIAGSFLLGLLSWRRCLGRGVRSVVNEGSVLHYLLSSPVSLPGQTRWRSTGIPGAPKYPCSAPPVLPEPFPGTVASSGWGRDSPHPVPRAGEVLTFPRWAAELGRSRTPAKAPSSTSGEQLGRTAARRSRGAVGCWVPWLRRC